MIEVTKPRPASFESRGDLNGRTGLGLLSGTKQKSVGESSSFSTLVDQI